MTPLFNSIQEAAHRCVGGYIKSDDGKWFRVRDTYGEFLTDGTPDIRVNYKHVTADMFKPFFFIYANRLCRMSRLTRRKPYLQSLAPENTSIFHTDEKGSRWAGHLTLQQLEEGSPVEVGKSGVTFSNGDFIIFRGHIYCRLTLIGKESNGEVTLDCDSITTSLFMSKYNVKR